MTGIEDQNPLRTQLENNLNNSEWLQKFKAINQLLHSLKSEITEIQSCELKWDTSCDGLVIHAPSIEVAQQLQLKQDTIISIAKYANCITLVAPGSSDIILKA
ncbi:MAG: hypothetical protein F6K11_26100 [Leptolyngbya sp. SIO3F4]|nr:hypothetical protein [Leptolyngbya sp. SIO3F4]